jgi:hypothetical protein
MSRGIGKTQQQILRCMYSKDGRGQAPLSMTMIRDQGYLFEGPSLGDFELRRAVRSLISRDLVESCGTITRTIGADWSKGRKGYQRTSIAYRLTDQGREVAAPLFAEIRSSVGAVVDLPPAGSSGGAAA